MAAKDRRDRSALRNVARVAPDAIAVRMNNPDFCLAIGTRPPPVRARTLAVEVEPDGLREASVLDERAGNDSLRVRRCRRHGLFGFALTEIRPGDVTAARLEPILLRRKHLTRQGDSNLQFNPVNLERFGDHDRELNGAARRQHHLRLVRAEQRQHLDATRELRALD